MVLAGYKLIKIGLAVWEILIGIKIGFSVLLRGEIEKKHKWIALSFSVILGGLLQFNREYAFVSWSMVLFCIFSTSIVMWIVSRKKIGLIFTIVMAYYW